MERRRQLYSVLAAGALIVAICTLAQAQYGGGSGTAEDPYLIYTPEQMNAIGADPNDWDKHFKLMADVDLSGYATDQFNMIGGERFEPFKGTFDGNGYAVINMTLSSKFGTGVGLFSGVNGADAEIRNLTLVDPVIGSDTGADYKGALVGWLAAGTVRNCSALNVSIECRCDAGGLVGCNSGTITGCCSTGQVTGYYSVGGLVGSSSGSVVNCYSMAQVTGIGHVGGLIGSADGRVANCYSTGTATGDEFIGGLVGSGPRSGLVIEGCFWDIETSGLTTSAAGLGRTTTQMQTIYTFAAWTGPDYGGVWTIDEGRDYPRLAWENAPGIAIGPEGALALLDGSGTADDPYLIHTPGEMNLIGADPDHWDKHYKLMADIDLSGYTADQFNLIGYYFVPPYMSSDRWSGFVPFTGVFDGNGHTVANFTYAPQYFEDSFIGLFAYVDDPNAQIMNLGLIDPNVGPASRDCDGQGTLVGRLGRGTITDCYAAGVRITGSHGVGGLVGYNEQGTIANCQASGIVTGDTSVGGLVGYSGSEYTDDLDKSQAALIDCSAEATVVVGQERVGGLAGSNSGLLTVCYSSGTVVGANDVGGLAGYVYFGEVSTCASLATVIGSNQVGGLVGLNYSAMTDCYAGGNVVGADSVGGLVGMSHARVWSGRSRDGEGAETFGVGIANCHATGMVGGTSHVGGLIGKNFGTVTQCFWDIETSGQPFSAGGVGGTTVQMQTAGTFSAWAAPEGEGVWTIDDGNDYPRLWWEEQPGEMLQVPHLAGTGTPDDPFLIGTAQELVAMAALASDWDKHFQLIADIDLSAYTGLFGVIGTYRTPFTGVFDGGGHVISNLSCASGIDLSNEGGNERCAGPFAYVDDPNALITNLGLIDPYVDTPEEYNVGALVRVLEDGMLSACFAKGGAVRGAGSVGGLVGRNFGSMMNCCAALDVIGESSVAGLAGYNAGTILNSYATGRVEGAQRAGGLVGSQGRGQVAISGSFWDIEASGQLESAGGTGLMTSEMQTAATFLEAGWDFIGETENGTEEVWWILEGQDYPRLWWERAEGEF